jgi:hypothetical protein
MVEKTAIGHSKTINEDTEFIVTKQQSSTMVQLYHGTRESTRSLTKITTPRLECYHPHGGAEWRRPLIVCSCSHTAGYLSALHIVDRAVLEDASSSTSDQV